MGSGSHGQIGMFPLASISLTLSAMMLTASLCQAAEKVPRRRPRQAAEDDRPGSRVPGLWSAWASWSACSQPCGLGVMERTRACQSPYQRVPWAGQPELAPQPLYPPQAHENRPASPYPGRPSYPLHTEGSARPGLPFRGSALTLHGQAQPPRTPRLGPQNRHTRHQALPAEELPSRDGVVLQHGRRRDPAPVQEAGVHPPRHRGNQESRRTPNQPFRQSAAARTPVRDAIPLFKPLRRDSPEVGLSPDRPRHGGQGDSDHRSWAASPTPESPVARRSRVREAIKPGKYGYGKLPFALPLHTDVAEGTQPRFKRHHGGRGGERPSPPPPPPPPPSKKQRRKAVRSSSREEEEQEETGRAKRPLSSGAEPRTPLKPKQPLLADAAAQPHAQTGEGVKSHLGHSHSEGHGHMANRGGTADTEQPTEPGTGTPQKSESSREAEHRGKAAASSLASHGEAQQAGGATAPSGNQHLPESSARPHEKRLPESSARPHEKHLPESSARSHEKRLPESSTRPHEKRLPESSARPQEKRLPESSARPQEKRLPESSARPHEKHLPESSASSHEKRLPESSASSHEKRLPESSASPHETPEVAESSTGGSIPTSGGGGEGGGHPTAAVTHSSSQGPSVAGSPLPHAQGELRLTHHVLRNNGSSAKRKGPGAGKSHRATPEPPRRPESSSVAQPDGAGHANRPPHGQSRSRNQRQNEHQAGGQGRRPSHSLFVDQPMAPRPAEPDIWLLHRGNPVQFHARGQPGGVRPGGEVPQWNLYYPGTETFHCEGESKQFKACRQEPCPPDRPDPRAVQCAAYNNQEFMGRLYQWEPFTDVRGSQRCELNCRPIGYRFYVRHTEKVQDGTPCESSSQDICVAGQCLTPGCDGVLGSNRTLDSCGVCGGDHTTCKLVVGNFSDTDVPIGYHRILEIPAGATRIQVKEMTRSPNYLALRSHSGKSIINGNWAVNPPGRYEAAGTVFVYSRPGSDRREGESLTAEGPTTEPIDVYMIFQQDNPGVSYQFFLASVQPETPTPDLRSPRQDFGALTVVSSGNQMEPPPSHQRPVPADARNLSPARLPASSGQSGRSRGAAPPPPVSSGQSGRSPGTLQRNVRVPPLPPPPPPVQHGSDPLQDFYWRRIGNTDCSATCGKGFWQSVYQCISRVTQEEVGEEKCHLIPKPIVSEEACNTEPCPAYWEAGEWSACSKSCGLGTQHRQVLCRQIYANRSTMVHPQRCAQLEKPNATQACQVQVCSRWEVRTNWSSCSVLCGTGLRTRHVRCVSNHGDLLRDSDCPGNHRPKTSEACDMGPCVRTWFYSDWSNTCSAECGTGIQRRSVVCLSSAANGQVEENCAGTKPADMRACNGGPCQRVNRWYTGPWSPCSSDCSTGTQRRDLICVSKLGAEFNVTDASDCAHLEKPPSLQPCVGTTCEARWFSTAWSSCSRSCVGGVQVREVQCLTQNKTLSNLCPPDLKPIKKRPCNVQPCLLDLDENCRDKYHNCPVIVQARLCVYSYYKAVCCASCTHALERRHAGPSR
ncbi:ADAMTS-like protein 4 [Podarcis raffonei]|uniref:ADAMTS-like protein 4 n=1 Tax=Podarcis raffonei TaxID=65483 RepID=UPI0023294A19|nr:ADAMTS-like protein 4 [Podarcis raffonei]XP_053225876.1 ADAMTS-like protein 4 [Podarcis raffonei]